MLNVPEASLILLSTVCKGDHIQYYSTCIFNFGTSKASPLTAITFHSVNDNNWGFAVDGRIFSFKS